MHICDTSLITLRQDFLSRMLSVGRYAKAPGGGWDGSREPPQPSGYPPAIRTGYPAHPSGAALAVTLSGDAQLGCMLCCPCDVLPWG